MKRSADNPYATNPWPPFVDAVVLVFSTVILITVISFSDQRKLKTELSKVNAQLSQIREDKARIERRLKSVAAAASIDVEDGRVVLQGEVLFDSGSATLTEDGRAYVARLVQPMNELLAAEPEHMLMVAGHTDDLPLKPDARFANNWELSAARALTMAREMTALGLPEKRIFAAGFGHHHPRVANTDDAQRQRNRRIEVLLVPMHGVSE